MIDVVLRSLSRRRNHRRSPSKDIHAILTAKASHVASRAVEYDSNCRRRANQTSTTKMMGMPRYSNSVNSSEPLWGRICVEHSRPTTNAGRIKGATTAVSSPAVVVLKQSRCRNNAANTTAIRTPVIGQQAQATDTAARLSSIGFTSVGWCWLWLHVGHHRFLPVFHVS